MEKRFDSVIQDLAGDLQDKVQQWVKEVADLTDVQAKQTGSMVLENLQNDEQFEDEPYREFVEALAKSLIPGSCVSNYNAACRKFHKRGPEATIPKTLPLHRLAKKQILARAIAIPSGWSAVEAEELYDSFMDMSLMNESD